MKHHINLSNNKRLVLEERDNCLDIGVSIGEHSSSERWLSCITTNGITVWEGGSFAKELVNGLIEEPPEEEDPYVG
jgi:hypothetical protein